MNFKSTETVAKVYARYMEDLQQNNAMDFDDLLWNAVKLLLKRVVRCFRIISRDLNI